MAGTNFTIDSLINDFKAFPPLLRWDANDIAAK